MLKNETRTLSNMINKDKLKMDLRSKFNTGDYENSQRKTEA